MATTPENYVEQASMNQPEGFWEKMLRLSKGLNSDPNKILGMNPDQFAMLAGSLAAKIAPGTMQGGAGEALANYGNVLYNQRMKEETPENRLAKAKADQLLAMTTGKPVSSNIAEVPSTGFSFTPEQFSPTAPAGQYEWSPLAATGQIPAPTQVQPVTPIQLMTISQAEGEMERQRKEAATTDVEKKVAQAQLAQTTTNTARAQQEIDQAALTGPVTLENLRATTKFNQIQAENAAKLQNVNLASAQTSLDMAQAQLEAQKYENEHADEKFKLQKDQSAQGWARIKQEEKNRKTTALNTATQALSNHVTTYIDHTNKQLASEETLPKAKPGIMINTGNALINAGVAHVTSAKSFEDVDPGRVSQAVGAQSIEAGINYYADAIRTDPTPEGRINSTTLLVRKLDQIATKQPEVARRLELMLFGMNSSLPQDARLTHLELRGNKQWGR